MKEGVVKQYTEMEVDRQYVDKNGQRTIDSLLADLWDKN